MSNKNRSHLGLPEVPTEFGFDSESSIVSVSDGYLSGAQRRRILAEAVRQKLAVDAVAAKSHYGLIKISEIDQNVVDKFFEIAHHNMNIKQRPQGMDCQPYMDEFIHYMNQVAAQHMSGVSKVSAKIIANEIARSPYPPADEEPKGLLKRIFGG